MSKSRGLSIPFMEALKDGVLKPLLELVQHDHTLDLQIRAEAVHIYYRGGLILKLKPSRNGEFVATFDKKYLENSKLSQTLALPHNVHDISSRIQSESDTREWHSNLLFLKQAIDFHKVKSERNEREFQQLVVRENNYSPASNDSDYFIVDMEYRHPTFPAGKVDLVAFKWESKPTRRKEGEVTLAFIEVKYGDKALTGKSGVREHIRLMTQLAMDTSALNVTRQEMLTVFRQKRELGVIRFGKNGNRNDVHCCSAQPPEIVLLLVNHDPTKSKLMTEMRELEKHECEMLRIATAKFFGYALYDECVFDYDTFMSRFSRQVDSKV